MPREEHGDRGPEALRRHVQSRPGQLRRRLVQEGLGEGAVAGGQMCMGSGEEPHGTAPRVWGQLCRPGQEGGLRGVAAAAFSPRGGAFKVGRDVRVRDDRGRGVMPCRLIRVPVLAGDTGQGVMNGTPVTWPGTVVDRGADEGMPEGHPRLHRDDVLRYGRLGVLWSEAEPGSGPPQGGRIIARPRGGQQQQGAGGGRQHPHLAQEVPLHAAADRQPLRQR